MPTSDEKKKKREARKSFFRRRFFKRVFTWNTLFNFFTFALIAGCFVILVIFVIEGIKAKEVVRTLTSSENIANTLRSAIPIDMIQEALMTAIGTDEFKTILQSTFVDLMMMGGSAQSPYSSDIAKITSGSCSGISNSNLCDKKSTLCSALDKCLQGRNVTMCDSYKSEVLTLCDSGDITNCMGFSDLDVCSRWRLACRDLRLCANTKSVSSCMSSVYRLQFICANQ